MPESDVFPQSSDQAEQAGKLKPVVKVVKKKLSRDPPGATARIESEQESHIYVNNYDYADFYPNQEKVRLVKTGQARDGVYSAESDSGLDVTPEGTPYTSQPESELLISDEKQEDEVKASPRQLEMMMMKESRSLPSAIKRKTDRLIFHEIHDGQYSNDFIT